MHQKMTTYPEYNLPGSSTIEKFWDSMPTSNNMSLKADLKIIVSDLFWFITTSQMKPSLSVNPKWKTPASPKASL